VPIPVEEPVVEESRNVFVEAAEESWEASLSVIGALGAGLIRVLVFSWWLVPIGLIAWIVLRRRSGSGASAPTMPDLPTPPVAPAAPSGG
jgi:hypothetical protein